MVTESSYASSQENILFSKSISTLKGIKKTIKQKAFYHKV